MDRAILLGLRSEGAAARAAGGADGVAGLAGRPHRLLPLPVPLPPPPSHPSTRAPSQARHRAAQGARGLPRQRRLRVSLHPPGFAYLWGGAWQDGGVGVRGAFGCGGGGRGGRLQTPHPRRHRARVQSRFCRPSLLKHPLVMCTRTGVGRAGGPGHSHGQPQRPRHLPHGPHRPGQGPLHFPPLSDTGNGQNGHLKSAYTTTSRTMESMSPLGDSIVEFFAQAYFSFVMDVK